MDILIISNTSIERLGYINIRGCEKDEKKKINKIN